MIYMEQMEAITDLMRVINEWEKRHGANLVMASGIKLWHPEDGEENALGQLVDEIGGVWSFAPAGGAK